jgi:hypothetical protein
MCIIFIEDDIINFEIISKVIYKNHGDKKFNRRTEE